MDRSDFINEVINRLNPSHSIEKIYRAEARRIWNSGLSYTVDEAVAEIKNKDRREDLMEKKI